MKQRLACRTVTSIAAFLLPGLPALASPPHLVLPFDFSLVGQKFFDRRQREFGANGLTNPTKIERSDFGKVTWRF